MEIAVVGLGCRFPGDIRDPASLWQFLLDRRCAIGEIPADRWNREAFYSPIAEATGFSRSKWGGFIDRVFDFDCEFFDISPAEAQRLDPQQRLLLQVAYEAIQDSGQTLAAMSAATTGVFVGISTSDFAGVLRYRNRNDDLWGGTGCALSISANRISHRLNLNGPSFPVDTACSSALIAIDQACRNIATGMCDQAIAGGVNCLFEPNQFIAFSNANMLSRTGRISTFDAAANGYVRSEGCGLAILRPLDRAIADGDRIYAVIAATAANQDGWTSTLMAPAMKAQESMLGTLVSRAGIEPGRVNYVEAHGTGTPTGDPIEAHAIGHQFGRVDREDRVTVGSVKPNLGHMEPAAGACGFIKTVLCVHHGMVPPNIHFETPNPAIPFDALNIQVPVEPREIGNDDGTRYGVVNSFGWGGANASALVRNFDPARSSKRGTRFRAAAWGDRGAITVVPVSAHSREALVRWTGRLAGSVSAEDGRPSSAAELAHALARHRDHFAERAAVLCNGAGTLGESLRAAAAEIESGETGSQTVFSAHAVTPRKVVFTFSGQGAQWWAMGRGLLQSSRTFSRAIDAFDRHFARHSGWRVRDVLSASEADSLVNQGEYAQPALIALQIALAETWIAHGVRPDAVLGHSLGEISAAHVAGALSLAEVARVMHVRSRIQHQAPERGAMAVAGMTADEIRRFLEPHPAVLISAFNNARTVTISGRKEPMEQVLAELEAHDPNLFIRRLNTDFAWHSELLDYGEEWFRENVGRVRWSRPVIAFISTVTGMPEEVFDLDYWWQNLRAPVSYHQAVDWAIGQGYNAFVEIGPDRTVTPLTMAIAQDAGGDIAVVHSLERKKSDEEAFKSAIARLYVAGVDLDWDQVCGRSRAPSHELPLYPWAEEPIRFMPRESEAALFEDFVHPLLGRRVFTPHIAWFCDIDVKRLAWLKDHRVVGDIVFPAAGFVEMMIAAVRDHAGPGPVELTSIHFREALSIKANGTVSTTTYFDPVTGKIEIYARARDTEEDWALRAEAYGWRRDIGIDAFQDGDLTRRAVIAEIENGDFYTLADRHGLNYGPAFRGVRKVALTGDSTSINTIQLPEAARIEQDRYLIHPAAFDSLLQASLGLTDYDAGLWWPEGDGTHIEDADDRYTLKLPVSINRLLWADRLPQEFRGHVWGQDDETGVFVAYGPDGRAILRVENMAVRAVTLSHGAVGDTQPVARYLAEQFLPLDVAVGAGADAGGPAEESEAPATHWFVIGGRAARRLGDALAASGRTCTVCAGPSLAGEIERWKGGAGDGAPAQVLYCAALDDGGADGDDAGAGDDVAARAGRVVENFIATARTLDTVSMAGLPVRLVVLTCRARASAADEAIPDSGLAQRSLIGAIRTVANEIQGLAARSIDLDQEALDAPGTLIDLILGEHEETEWIVRGGRCYVPRLQEMAPENLRPRTEVIDTRADRRNYAVAVSKPGSFDNLLLREEAMPECGPGQVLIETASVGLNFRDVMATTGVLPGEPADDTAWWCNLGGESSGTVIAVGDGVSEFKPGDRVVAYGKGLMRRFAAVDENRVAPVPDGIDLKAAAAVPVAYLTALYCLQTIARLHKGERVLIHLGTGGVGLAAIQVARHIGAEIFATAGSERKRQYLRDLGIGHVMDSRALTFGDEILAATRGEGVDVVLNSLAGAAIDVGLGCLAPFGRFVEIGKRDVEDDKPIGLKTLSENKSYSVVDLSVMNRHARRLAQDILGQTFTHLAAGDYANVPVTHYSSETVGEAMRLMGRAEHIGKILIDFNDGGIPVHQNVSTPARFRADRGYLVTGGTGGFGIVLADWLSRSGAGAVHLASRRGTLDADGEALVAGMRARGTRVEAVALDVTSRDDVFAFFARENGRGQPVAGIYHAAAVLDDGLLSQLDGDRIARVMRPKAAGGWNLHLASLEAGSTVDHFVVFSSIAEVLGSAGQANYAAANSFLNGLAEYRRARGLAGNSVCLGALSETGMVARSDSLGGYLDSLGIKPMDNADVVGAFARIARIENPVLTFAAIDWPALGRAMPNTATAPRVNALVAASSARHSLLRGELASAPRERWNDIVARTVQDEIVKVLKIEGRELPVDQPFAEIGIDSLSAFELKNRIEGLADVSVSASRFLQSPTIQGVSQIIAEAIEESERELAEAGEQSGDGEGKRGGGRAITVLAAQRRWLAGANAAAAPVNVAELTLPENFSEQELGEAVAAVAARHSAVRLSLDPAGGLDLGGQAAIALAHAGPGVGLGPLPAADGALWRFELVRGDGADRTLRVGAHPLAGDAASVHLVAGEVLGHLEGRAPTGEATADWGPIAATRTAEIGSPEDFAGRGYWREMLSRIGQPRLPHASALGHVHRPLTDRHRKVGVLTFAATNGAMEPGDNEEALVIASFASAIGKLGGSDSLVVERWTSGRNDWPTAVGPIARRVPVVFDAMRNQRHGPVAASALMLGEADLHPAFDSPAIEDALGGEMPRQIALLRQFAVAYVDTGETGADVARSLVRGLRLDMGHDIALTAVREGGAIALELLFDQGRITEADARAVGEALVDALDALGAGRGSGKSALAGTWRRNRALERERADAVEALARRAEQATRPLAAPAGVVRAADGSLPLSMQQSFLLEALRHPQVTDDFRKFWWVSRAFRVRPSIDFKRLKAAAALVAGRHDTARTRFIETKGTTRALIERSYEPHLELRDFGRVGEDEIVRVIEEFDQRTPDPYTDPLWAITVLRCGEDGDVIYVRAHHSVFDGWSTALFIEEMLRAYMGQDLPAVDLTLSEYLNRYDRSCDSRLMAEREAYFRDLLRDAPPIHSLHEGLGASRPNLEFVHAGIAQELVVTVADSQKLDIIERARMSGASPSALLVGAMAQSIAAVSGTSEDILICVPMAMRQDLALRHYLGWVATISPVRCKVAQHRSLDTLAKQIFDQYQTSMLHLPADFTLRRGALHRELGAEGSYLTLFEAGMLTADASRGESSVRDLTRLGADQAVRFAGYEIQPIGNGRVRAGCAYHVDIRSFEGPAGHSYRCCYDSDVVAPETARNLFREVLGRLGVSDASLGTIRENGALVMDPAAE